MIETFKVLLIGKNFLLVSLTFAKGWPENREETWQH
jgi:hypothetical protein